MPGLTSSTGLLRRVRRAASQVLGVALSGLRFAHLAIHASMGVAAVALLFPWASSAFRLTWKRRWSRHLFRCLGVELCLRGELPSGLIVANHISFLDIFAINALTPVVFVAKADVRHWPIIGWLASRTDTLFLERGSSVAAFTARSALVRYLSAGVGAALFPEGTTTRGDIVLPFHGALLQAAIDVGSPVTPLAIRYCHRDGRRSEAAAYVDDLTLWQCLVSIASSHGLVARVEVLAPLPPLTTDRRHLAATAHRAIAECIGSVKPPY